MRSWAAARVAAMVQMMEPAMVPLGEPNNKAPNQRSNNKNHTRKKITIIQLSRKKKKKKKRKKERKKEIERTGGVAAVSVGIEDLVEGVVVQARVRNRSDDIRVDRGADTEHVGVVKLTGERQRSKICAIPKKSGQISWRTLTRNRCLNSKW